MQFEKLNYPYITFAMSEILFRAQQQGYAIEIDQSTGFCAKILVKGRLKIIIGADVGLNSSAACRLSQDKFITELFLRRGQLNSIESILVNSVKDIQQLDIFSPCIVKPNRGFAGQGISLISKLDYLAEAITSAQKYAPQVLLQRYVSKPEYRIVMLDGECLFAYERKPWIIIGDGKKMLSNFIAERNQALTARQQIQDTDSRLQLRLKQMGFHLRSVVERGHKLQLFVNTNLKSGADWGVVQHIHPRYIELCADAASLIGLRFLGVDIFCKQLKQFDENYQLIELNANPGFEYLRHNSDKRCRVFDKITNAIFAV